MGGSDVPVHLLNETSSEPDITTYSDAGHWHDLLPVAGVAIPLATSVLQWSRCSLAGETLSVGADDPRFFPDFQAVLGAAAASGEGDSRLVARAVTRSGVPGYGHFTIARDGSAVAARDYLIGLGKPDCPYRVENARDGWTLVFDGEAKAPAIVFREADVLFRLVDTWTVVVLSFLFRAAFGVHREAILFHAASVSVLGRGFMFCGPRRAGKSTLATALATRGHGFLGDEIAWYLPETQELCAFRRPVGVREGVRAQAVDEALRVAAPLGTFWYDSLRLPIDLLVPQKPAQNVKLHSVFLLREFEASPRLERLQPTLEHLQEFQPIMLSLLNAPAGRRLLQLTRLLAAARVYALHPGHPDATVRMLEELAGDHELVRH